VTEEASRDKDARSGRHGVAGTAPRARWIAYAALAGAVVAIAWSAILVRWAGIPGSSSAFYRVAVALCVLLPWRIARGAPASRAHTLPGGAKALPRGAHTLPRSAIGLAVAAGLFFALDLAFFNTAVMRTSAATTSLLGSNAPVFVGLGAWLLLGKRPHTLFWAGLAASLCGIVLMIWAGASSSPVRHDLVGDLMAIAAAFTFAGYILAVSKARDAMDTLTLNTIAIAVSTIALLPICLAIGAPLWGYSRETWTALVWLGLVSQVGAYLCIAYALGHLPATVVSIALLAQAPLTALLAAALLHERLTPLQLAGGALVLAGIYVVNRAET
jgi:drug/metabolite transporter (DMT)-like permease